MTSPIWHPFTQHALYPAMRPIARGEGAWLIDDEGRRLFDAISSWWVITHGHCEPRIVDAIRAQAEQLDQVIFAGYTHAPAEAVAAALLRLTPDALTRVFFSDSGSTSVEVAIKMALGYWRHRGSPRHRIAVLEHGYHGDTIGTMSVGERGPYNVAYEPLLYAVETVPFPTPGREQASYDALERACARGELAAFLVEPLALGAGGMYFYPPSVLAEYAKICAAHDVLLIADEVMTGFGRTGSFLATEQAGVVPDILCLAKGLTGGSLPLAVTLCAEKIYAAHYAPDRARTFFHSSSYTANPIACAAAAANLAIWEQDGDAVRARIAAIAGQQAAAAARLSASPGLRNVRALGTLLAADLGGDGYMAASHGALMAFFAERDLLIRPLGDVVYLMPPYCADDAALARCHDAIADAADAAASRRSD